MRYFNPILLLFPGIVACARSACSTPQVLTVRGVMTGTMEMLWMPGTAGHVTVIGMEQRSVTTTLESAGAGRGWRVPGVIIARQITGDLIFMEAQAALLVTAVRQVSLASVTRRQVSVCASLV